MLPYLLLALAFCSLLGLFLYYSYCIEPYRFRVLRRTLHSRACPADVIRVLHITDSHFKLGDEEKLAFAKSLGRYEVDFAFLTGDLIEDASGVRYCADMVRSLRPRYGTFVALGGHDYFEVTCFEVMLDALTRGGRHRSMPNPTEELVRQLTDAGARVLVNEATTVDVRGHRVAIVGLDDPFFGCPELEKAWRNVPESAFKMVLVHCPDVVDEIAARGADVAFAGHTHGGQIRIPPVGAVITRSTLHPRHASGIFRIGHTAFHINNGLGSGKWTHLRLFCRPEATIVEIMPSS
ncbi:MAG: hypothetical protein FJ272_18865 [Planctomycetes bacterium]|nr:hypothetical protein [Planctomycetota bacterium]